MSAPLTINVRFDSSHSVPIEADPSWSIRQLKVAVGEKRGVNPEDIRIIFQGSEPAETMCLMESDIADHTVLHAVQVCRPSVVMETTSQGLNEISSLMHASYSPAPAQGQGDPGGTQPSRQQFYVFCKNECEAVRPGRLRVRCAVCKQGTITVVHGPNDWKDVLCPNRICGQCQADGCSGTTAEFYFKCNGHVSSFENDSAAPLHMIKTNTQQKPCIVCFDIKCPILVFPCADSHIMCLECFNTYCETRLNERAFIYSPELGYTLGCPAGCENSFITEGHHFRVLGKDQYDRYQKFAAEENLLQSGGVLCPTPGCGAGLLPDEGDRRVECIRQGAEGCGFVFCRNCKLAYHEGECNPQQTAQAAITEAQDRYLIDPQAAQRARWDLESMSTIDRTTKPCPQCHTPTERNEGCMHMICRCGFGWCWLCQKRWDRDCQGDHWFG